MALNTRVRAMLNNPTAGVGESANSTEASYSSIWLRNVFDLKPVISVTTKDPSTIEPPPNIKLQGITTIFGDKRAILSVQPTASPGKPAGKEESYTLSEGQRQGSVEVVEINPKARKVKIKVDDLVSIITFETNKAAGGGGPGGGVPRVPGAPPPTRGFNNVGNNGGYAPTAAPVNSAAPAVPFRPVRTAGDTQVMPQGGGGGYAGGYAQAASFQAAQNTSISSSPPILVRQRKTGLLRVP
jgi:hypothetical protein